MKLNTSYFRNPTSTLQDLQKLYKHSGYPTELSHMFLYVSSLSFRVSSLDNYKCRQFQKEFCIIQVIHKYISFIKMDIKIPDNSSSPFHRLCLCILTCRTSLFMNIILCCFVFNILASYSVLFIVCQGIFLCGS